MVRMVAASRPVPVLSKNELRRRAQALATLEASVTQTEATLEELTHALQQAAERQEFERVQDLSRQYAETEDRLQHLLEQWEELAHAAPSDHRIDR